MSKPTGDSLHPREHGFWSRGSLPALPAALIVTSAILLAILFGPAPNALAGTFIPRLIPPTAETSADTPGTKGLIATRESSPTGRWIVAGRPGRQSVTLAESFGATAISHPLGLYVIEEGSATNFIVSLRRNGAYRYSEPDVPTNPQGNFARDTSSDMKAGQWWLEDINRPRTLPRVTDKSPAIALLESSLDPKHPDLVGLGNRPNRLLNPFSFGNDRDARGTAMAALAASLPREKDKGEVTGVWPGMRVRLVPSNESCAGKTRAVYQAARNRDNRVLAMGYSFPGQSCHSHYEATEYAVYRGMVPVAAAGDPSSASDSVPPTPAGDPHVLTVTPSGQERTVPAWAGRGPWVDLVAPGDGLRVAWVNAGRRAWSTQSGPAYSATVVAAAVAWIMQARPKIKARQVIRLLTNSAAPLGQSERNEISGHGMLNLSRALNEPLPVNDPFEPNDDIDWVRASSAILDGPSGKGKRVKRKPFRRASDKKREVIATLGRTKDPRDVYRIEIAPGTNVLTKVTANGWTDLKIFKPGAKNVADRGNLVVESVSQPKGSTYALSVNNTSPRQLTAFVALGVGAEQKRENFSYRLTVKPCPVSVCN